jgi:putative endonuclease
MVFVYTLKSLASDLHYVGISDDVARRLKEHNAGKSKFTKGHMPWILIYKESFPDYASARIREKYLKSAAGKRWLRKNEII